jgi:hypothetical protein
VPADAAPVKPLKGGETRVDVSGDHLEIVASTPISGQKTVSGAVIVTTPIDLAAVKRSLANHVAGAALVGFGTDVVLVGQAAPVNASIKLALPPGDWNSAGVSLVAMPLATADDSLAWVDPVRYGALGVAALFVLVYVVGWRRAARERARTSAY